MGKTIAEKILSKKSGQNAYANDIVVAGFSQKEIGVICRAIREHRTHTEGMSLLGELLSRADNLSRACHECSAKDKCYKFSAMETGNHVLIY